MNRRILPDLLAAALDYAARGLPVFPCAPRGKTPASRARLP